MVSREDKAIEQFCARLSFIEKEEVRIVARPDRDSPGHGGCDAVISRRGRRFALEHTTIDSFAGQRADDARFNELIVPLEEAVRAAHPDSWIEIVVPVNAFHRGVDWPQVSRALRDACISTIVQIPFDQGLREFKLEGVPFPVWISRREDRRNPACYVARQAPGNLEAHLEESMLRAIRQKRDQLAPYWRGGLPTILLLDSDDIALVNRDSLAEAFGRAAGREPVEGLDEVFIAEADRDPIWFYPVKLYDRRYPDLPEFMQFFQAQYFLMYGGSR